MKKADGGDITFLQLQPKKVIFAVKMSTCCEDSPSGF